MFQQIVGLHHTLLSLPNALYALFFKGYGKNYIFRKLRQAVSSAALR